MSIIKLNHYQSSWSNRNKKDLIDELTNELIKSDGRSQLNHFEERKEEKTETQSRYLHRKSSSLRPPRRGTEIPGWYKQMYSEMGNPQSITSLLIKQNRDRSLVHGNAIKPPFPEITHHIRLDSSPNRPNTSNSYETESSRSSTPGRDSSLSPMRDNQIERNVGGIIDEPIGDRQEYYPYRDAHHGKPLPGENGFMIDSSSTNMSPNGRRHESNSPSPKSGSPEYQPALRIVSKTPPRIKIYSQSTRSRSQSSPSPLSLSRSPSRGTNRVLTHYHNRRSTSVPPPNKSNKEEIPVPITLTPLPEYFFHLRHIKVTSIPVPIPPKFGTLTQGGRWPNEAQGPVDVGPPCHLCKKPITESRFISHDEFIYHCWHFTCSHCLKTLKYDDFRMDKSNKPYCVNCFKRQYP